MEFVDEGDEIALLKIKFYELDYVNQAFLLIISYYKTYLA